MPVDFRRFVRCASIGFIRRDPISSRPLFLTPQSRSKPAMLTFLIFRLMESRCYTEEASRPSQAEVFWRIGPASRQSESPSALLARQAGRQRKAHGQKTSTCQASRPPYWFGWVFLLLGDVAS